MREWIKAIPGVVPLVRAFRGATRGSPERFDSANYWERRYADGGNSGAGSYNRLAEYKARFLNDFVKANDVSTLIEFGCGDGAQLLLAEYPAYLGVDVSPTILRKTAEKFAWDNSKRFVLTDELPDEARADVTLSLDVIYHLIEDRIFEDYMATLFGRADRFVVVYSNNEETPWEGAHVRNRRFSDWVDSNRKEFELVEVMKNPYPENPDDPENTSIANFYIYRRT